MNLGDKKLVLSVLIIQLLSACIAFIAPIIINSINGSSALAEILYVYSLFVLFYSFFNFGIPDEIQVWRSKGGDVRYLSKFFALLFFVAILFLLFSYIFNSDFSLFFLITFCFNYVLFESFCRILNQDGSVILGQILLSLFPILFWLNSLAGIVSIEFSLFFISLALTLLSLFFIFKNKKKEDTHSKLIKFSLNGSLKIYVTRVYASVLDSGPIIFLFHLNLDEHVVIYGLLTRLILPLSMLIQSFNSVLLRKKIVGNFTLPKLNKNFIFGILILVSILITVIYKILNEYLNEFLDIPILANLFIFSVAVYRFTIFGFIIQNSWNIEKINKIKLTILFLLPILTLAALLIFYLFDLPIYTLFIMMVLVILFLIIVFGKNYSNI